MGELWHLPAIVNSLIGGPFWVWVDSSLCIWHVRADCLPALRRAGSCVSQDVWHSATIVCVAKIEISLLLLACQCWPLHLRKVFQIERTLARLLFTFVLYTLAWEVTGSSLHPFQVSEKNK